MEDFKVLSVLKKFMSEEQYEAFKEKSVAFETELNTDITKYVTANTPDSDKLLVEAKKTAHQEVIKELNIKGVATVEQLNGHMLDVKKSSTEQAKELTALKTSQSELQTNYDTEVANRTKFETETKLSSELELIKSLKQSKYDLEDEDAVEFLHSKLSKQVTEELPFEEVVKVFQSENTREEPKQRYHDPRMVKPVIANQKDSDNGYEIYKKLKKEGKI